MKCEICHQADAKKAIVRATEGGEEELYVCEACAAKERARRQKKSTRTIKSPDGSASLTITECSGSIEDAPPFLGAIIEAMNNVVSGIEGSGDAKTAQQSRASRKAKLHRLPTERADAIYRVGDALHLEGLYLIGEIDAVQRALHALGMELDVTEADGIKAPGHVYHVNYEGSAERARRVVEDLLAQERNARVRLFEEMPRVFGDALCRALALLKNVRLLSPAEYFDLLSPLRLAAAEKLLEGIDLKRIDKLMAGIQLDGREDRLEQNERDRIDADRADAVRTLFDDVILNETAEGRFL